MIFEITEEQMEKIRKFHPKCKKKDRGAIGGGDYYIFMPTGIGVVIKYKCICGCELDLTNFDSW